ncbi:PREDICTED: elafin [Condylura cristata]|uniref:elafin n=1 Tax=Condylura cristata TaxID=143302 RepID=UPI00033456B5|nr:PREDICTED: elafin [Condylura cristata]
MRFSSFLALAVFLILGMLATQAAVMAGKVHIPVRVQDSVKGKDIVKGQGPVRGPGPVKGQDPVRSKGPVKGQDPVRGEGPVKGQDPVRSQGPVKGQDPVRGQGPASVKPGTCPTVMIRCAMFNPPAKCQSDTECPGAKKCCEGSCGMACLDPQ